MTSPICEYQGVLQEWAPETRLLFQIPAKALRGIFSHDLKLTCVDVVAEFITLGTNCGLVYWYCRETAELQCLRIENTSCSVTCVKIVSAADFMLAAGTDSGNITVFQIPKKVPDLLPEAMKPKDNKQVERFSIDGLHKGDVTCLEWSSCGKKLFSGDKNGIVVLTSIDYDTQISKSSALFNEQFEIVQLSYYQNTLLISTMYRTIVSDGDANWRVSQIGTKERKALGKFGATFCKFDHGTVIYASRPGQRLWLADKSGTVQHTLIFKSAVQSAHPKVTLINPFLRKGEIDRNFGKVLQFGENCLVCYQSEILYILHPAAVTVVASLDCARKILDVAINKDEIYILEGDRNLLRIGYAPDSYANHIVEDISNRRRSFLFDDIANKIKDTAGSFKRITTELISSSDKVSPPALADEAIDLPPIQSLPKDFFGPDKNVEIHESYEELGANANTGAVRRIMQKTLDPEEGVVIRPSRRRKKKTHLLVHSGAESESDSMSTASEDRLVCGYVNEPSVSEESPSSWSQSQSGFSMLRDIHSLLPAPQQNALKALPETPKSPDDRSILSLDTCESVSENLGAHADAFREEQEKTFIRLANQEMIDSLNSDRTENMSISVNMTPSSSASSKLSENIASSELSENVSMVSECDDLPQVVHLEQPHHSAETSSVSSGNSQVKEAAGSDWNKEMILSQMLGLDLEDPLNQFRSKTSEASSSNTDCETPVVENPSCVGASVMNFPEADPKLPSMDSLCYGPPSGSSLVTSCHPSLDLNTGPAQLSNPQALTVDKSDCWLQYKTPDGVANLSVCNNYVVFTTDLHAAFYSQLRGISLTWMALDYKASSVVMSRDGKLVWVMGLDSVVALVKPSFNGPFSDKLEPAAGNVRSFAVDDDFAVYVGPDGGMKCQRKLIRVPIGPSEDLPCPWLVNSVAYRDGVLLAITCDEKLICKQSHSAEFVPVVTPSPVVKSVAIGPGKLVWIVDAANNIYFSDDYLSTQPQWWEVLISEYIFNHSLEPFLNLHNRVKSGIEYALNQTKQTCIAANDCSVWVYKKSTPFVQVNKTSFTGYIWEDITLKMMVKIKFIAAQGVFEEKGHVWLLSATNDVFCIAADSVERVQSVSNPSTSNITCIASAPDTMWALSEEGTIYARLGLTDSCLVGTAWRVLRLPGLADLPLVWVSCGCDVAWCVDVAGRVFMTPVPPYNIATNIFDAAWVPIEDPPKNVLLTKVFVGPNSYMVWAVDSDEQIYVREGIVANHQIGTGWVHVGGITAKYLSVSSTAVWAVGSCGNIYRRHGISENNYIGDYWRRIPGKLNGLSVTFGDDLWGVSTLAGAVRLLQRKVLLESNQDEPHSVSLDDDDLVIID